MQARVLGLVVLISGLTSLAEAKQSAFTLRQARAIAANAVRTGASTGAPDKRTYFDTMDGAHYSGGSVDGKVVRVMFEGPVRRVGRVFQVRPDGKVIHLHTYTKAANGTNQLERTTYGVGPEAGTSHIWDGSRNRVQGRDGRGHFTPWNRADSP